MVRRVRVVAHEAGGAGEAVDRRRDLQPHVHRVAELAERLRSLVDVLAPRLQLRVAGVGGRVVEVGYERADALLDRRPVRLDRVPHRPDALVPDQEVVQLVEDRLAPGQTAQGSEQGADRRRSRRLVLRLVRTLRVRLEEDEVALDLVGRVALLDRAEHRAERPVVEHPAVDEIRPARHGVGERVRAEEALDVRRRRRARRQDLRERAGRGPAGIRPGRLDVARAASVSAPFSLAVKSLRWSER